VDDQTVCSVVPQWTDMVSPDAEMVMGKGRALLRVSDLMELTRLIARLDQNKLGGHSDALGVKQKTPQK
jgi:hypothetical protein